jgi:uncharacterized membrane protein
LTGAQRIVSFLVLGTVLLVVSLVFTMLRTRQNRARQHEEDGQGDAPPPEE